ncbi:MAG: META domain-containing protein [Chloroflexota bacterium]
MSSRNLLATVLVVAALGVACGGSSSTSSPTTQTLEVRTFLSTRVDGPALVAGTVIRITFQNGRVSVNAGCNTFGGPYRIDGDRLVVGQIITTEIGCQPNLAAQDQWVSGLIGGATIALDGNNLTLALSGIRVAFLDRVVADPDRPLLGTPWVVDGLITGGATSSVPAGLTASVTLTETSVDVETGCNSGGGPVTNADGTLTFGDLILSKKACTGPGAALEGAVTAVLHGTVAYQIVADQLTLKSDALGLTLRAAP